MRYKGFWINISLFWLSFFLSLGGLEIGIRYLLPIYDPSGELWFYGTNDGVPLLLPGTKRMWKNTGDYNVKVDVNQYGFRDVKDLKESTINDWFVVGDSFSMGHGVEETERFSDLLQQKIGLHFYNISIPSDFNGYEKLIDYAQKKNSIIKNLIIGVCMENDLQNYETSRYIEVLPPKEMDIVEKIKDRFLFLKHTLRMHSAVYNAITSIVKRNVFFRNIALKLKLISDPKAIYPSRHYDRQILLRSADKLVSIAQRFHTLVLLIPSRGLWYGDYKKDEDRLHVEFVSLLKQAGLTVIDLRPIFEASGNPMQYHFQYDGHWNRLGHQKAADILMPYIKKKTNSN